MRFLVRATMPVEAGNDLVKDPSMGNKMENVMGDIKPEAVYYCLDRGQRTIYFVVNVEGSHQIPGICEPLWHTFKADIEFIPAMNQEDFDRAISSLDQVLSKY